MLVWAADERLDAPAEKQERRGRGVDPGGSRQITQQPGTGTTATGEAGSTRDLLLGGHGGRGARYGRMTCSKGLWCGRRRRMGAASVSWREP